MLKKQVPLTPEDYAIVYGGPRHGKGAPLRLNLTRIAMVGYDQLSHDQWTCLTVTVLAGRALAAFLNAEAAQRFRRAGALH